MVSGRRPGLHHRGLGHGAGHDSGSGISLFWTSTQKVGAEHDLGLYGFFLGHHLPVVFLGLLAGFQSIRDEWIHR